MDSPNDNPPLEPRLPDTDDLIFLCRRLNEAGAKYIVVGGFAIIQHGFARATEDIDLLIDTSPENIARVKARVLERQAVGLEVALRCFDRRSRQVNRVRPASARYCCMYRKATGVPEQV